MSSSLEERLYATTDANHNVTSIDDVFGAVKERFVYDPYRQSTVLSAAWASTADTLAWSSRSQGEREDATTNTIDGRSRLYGIGMGRWMQADSEGYVDGANRYQFVKSSPISAVDPTGAKRLVITFEGAGGFDGKKGNNPLSFTDGLSKPSLKNFVNNGIFIYPDTNVTDEDTDLIYLAEYNQMYAHTFIKNRYKQEKEQNEKNGAGSCGLYDALMIIGFSNGGTAAIKLASMLERDGIKVYGVVTIDPVQKLWILNDRGGGKRTSNVEHWYNYYQHGDVHSLFGIKLRGFSIPGADIDKELVASDFSFPTSTPADEKARYESSHFSGWITGQQDVQNGIRSLYDSMPLQQDSYKVGAK